MNECYGQGKCEKCGATFPVLNEGGSSRCSCSQEMPDKKYTKEEIEIYLGMEKKECACTFYSCTCYMVSHRIIRQLLAEKEEVEKVIGQLKDNLEHDLHTDICQCRVEELLTIINVYNDNQLPKLSDLRGCIKELTDE